jgi:hypothetical protein
VGGEGASSRRRLEAPPVAIVDPPVFPHDPVFGLLRMTAKGPGAQLHIQRVIQAAKDLCTGDMTVIVAPPANAGVERVNEPVLDRVVMAANGLTQLGALIHDRGATGRDDGFEPMQATLAISTRLGFPHGVMPDVKAEKVEAWGVVNRL